MRSNTHGGEPIFQNPNFPDSNEFHVRKNDPRNLSSANVESFVFVRRLVGVTLTWGSFLCPHSFAVIPKSVLSSGKGMRAKEWGTVETANDEILVAAMPRQAFSRLCGAPVLSG